MPLMPVPHLADSIVVGQIQTPLEGAIVFEPSTPARSALRELRSRNFDQAPVVSGGLPLGYVLARDIEGSRGTVEAHVRQILPHALASELAGLDEALHWLGLSGFLFVLRGRSISGFVAPSDINRQAGRAYFYLALTELELELAEAVRGIARKQDILDLLPAKAVNAVRGRMRARVDANVEADLVAEMTLAHLFEVIGAEGTLRTRLGYESVEEWVAAWHPLNDLRRRIAHPTKPLLAATDEMPWLVSANSEAIRLSRALSETRRVAAPWGDPAAS